MTLEEIRTRVLTRVQADPGDALAIAAANAAINEGQRLFALLTLCLEATREFRLTPGLWRYRMLREWVDWIAALRVRVSNDQTLGNTAEFDAIEGDTAMFNEEQFAARPAVATAPKLRPARLSDLAALDDSWIAAPGTPTRYATAGFDGLYVYKQPPAPGTILLITYARSPVSLVRDDDVPEIPETDHPALWQYAIPRLRLSEGGQELQKSLRYLASFVDAAKRRAAHVRARSLAARYDKLPPELERVDLSRVMRIRPDLPPWRKETAWPKT